MWVHIIHEAHYTQQNVVYGIHLLHHFMLIYSSLIDLSAFIKYMFLEVLSYWPFITDEREDGGGDGADGCVDFVCTSP